jgi:adenylate cyclase
VRLLVRRGSVGDQDEAQAAIDRLAAVPADPGFVLHELPLLRSRALLSLVRGDDENYRTFLKQHRARAAAAGFDALVAAADATAAETHSNSSVS